MLDNKIIECYLNNQERHETNLIYKGDWNMRLYHKATNAGIFNLIEEYQNSRICCSSDDSNRLFWRDCCIIFEVSEKNIKVQKDNDIDARNITEYDEIRIEFETKKEYAIVVGKDKPIIKLTK